MSILRKLFFILSRREKIQIIPLILLMLIGVVFETLSIGLMVPFISQFNDPQAQFIKNAKISWIYQLSGLTSEHEFLMWSTIALIVFFIFKGAYLFFISSVQFRFIYENRSLLFVRVFKFYLEKPYAYHLQRNSAELLQNTNDAVNHVYSGMLLSVLTLLTEILVITGICILLFVFEPYITLASIAVVGTLSVSFNYAFRKKLDEYSKKHKYHGWQVYKLFNQSFETVKEIKVMQKESFFVDLIRKHAVSFGNVDRVFSIVRLSPRIIIETIVIAFVLGIVIVMQSRSGGLSNIMPVLALFAMSSVRLIPSITRVNSAIINIRSIKAYVDELYKDLFCGREIDLIEYGGTEMPAMAYSSEINGNPCYIKIVDLSYKYFGAKDYSLKDVSLAIPRNSSVAFVGESGAGKTTLADIILGLLKPTEGTVFVDGKNIFSDVREWQKKIGYIPQTINLLDDSIRRNIAFGVPDSEIDDIKVWKALEAAQLKSFAEQLPEGLNTSIGERGARLSGGQRQRIGIARALYCEPEVLIFDEATSSLDGETESEVMKAIADIKGKKTIIIIAHRLSTIESCDTIFELQSGKPLNTIKR